MLLWNIALIKRSVGPLFHQPFLRDGPSVSAHRIEANTTLYYPIPSPFTRCLLLFLQNILVSISAACRKMEVTGSVINKIKMMNYKTFFRLSWIFYFLFFSNVVSIFTLMFSIFTNALNIISPRQLHLNHNRISNYTTAVTVSQCLNI